jgi:fucose permease
MKPIEEEREREIKEVGIDNAKSVWYNNETENKLYSFNRPVFEFVAFQTAITFIFSLGGLFFTTKKKFFKRLSLAFGIMTALILFAYFMASIIPTSGVVG